MKTRCKFQVIKVARLNWGPAEEVTLSAVHGGLTDEDKSFSQFTPVGQMTFTVTNPDVIGKIEPGQFYYIDLIPVETKE